MPPARDALPALFVTCATMAAVRAQRAAGVAALALQRALAAPAPAMAAAAAMRVTAPIVSNRLALHSTAAAAVVPVPVPSKPVAPAVPATPPVGMKEKHRTLPAAVVMWLSSLPPGHPATALLAGHVAATTSIDLSTDQGVTDRHIARLPPTVRELDVSCCRVLTRDVSFAHLTALESLDCSATEAVDGGLSRLPPSLQRLQMGACALPATADFSHLTALRVVKFHQYSKEEVTAKLSKDMLASLPPSMEELEIPSWPRGASLAHLTRLRVLRVSGTKIDAAGLATLPPTLTDLDISDCDNLSLSTTSFARFTRLRTLQARGARIGDAALATLPPSLKSLNLSCRYHKSSALTRAAVFPNLPALRVLDVNSTGIGDAGVASMPARLEDLDMTHCRGVTQRASLDHLTALGKLECGGTDLPRATLAACRARGCVAHADGVVRGATTFNGTLAVLPGGRLVNTPSRGVVALWDVARGDAPVAKLRIPVREPIWDKHRYRYVSALAALPNDSRHVAVGVSDELLSSEGGVYVWDTQVSPHTVDAIIAVDSSVNALAVLPDGRLVAGGGKGKIFVVDCDARAVVATLEGHTGAVTALAVLPDGGLASASKDGTVRLWDVAAKVCVGQLKGHTGGATALAVLSDGRLACASENRAVRLWDVGRRATVAILGTHYSWSSGIDALAVLADNRLAGVTAGGEVRVWDTRDVTAGAGEESQPVAEWRVPTTKPTIYGDRAPISLASLPDGRLATSGGGLHLWHLPAPAPVPSVPVPSVRRRPAARRGTT